MPTAIEEADSGQPSDIDMDRFGMISLTPMTSDFASLLLLAHRIRERGIARRFLDMRPVEDLPSSVFQWNSRSLRLLGDARVTCDGGIAAGNPAHFDRPQSVQVSDRAHPIHVEQGTDDSRKVIYDTRMHLHQTTGNFSAI